MTVETILNIGIQSLVTVIYVVGPPLVAAMAVGLFVAVLQAATQIQETSLTFIPKIVTVGVVLAIAGKWSMSHLVEFTLNIVSQMEGMGH